MNKSQPDVTRFWEDDGRDSWIDSTDLCLGDVCDELIICQSEHVPLDEALSSSYESLGDALPEADLPLGRDGEHARLSPDRMTDQLRVAQRGRSR